MQQIENVSARTGVERKRVEAVVETLATVHSTGESLAEVAHDARNMVTALGLYCDLLEEPGVLAPAFTHYGSELRLVATASRRLVEKLVALDSPPGPQPSFWRGGTPSAEQWPLSLPSESPLRQNRQWESMPTAPMANLAAELLATRNLLAALAGPSIALTVDAQGGALPVRISGEDLTRVLVNLVKNSVEAMPSGGRIQIALREQAPSADLNAAPNTDQNAKSAVAPAGKPWLALTVEDSGPGIPAEALEKIFESGYTAHTPGAPAGNWPAAHRGLGLAISRSIVEKAGGRIHAENRPLGGVRIAIELPVEQ